jgi:DNA-directed RNA polymerase specialized sigma subunit
VPETLEPEYAEPYANWKREPSPHHAAKLLEAVDPLVRGAVATHIGRLDALSHSRARRMALEALPRYDPRAGRLKPFLYAQLQGMKRYAAAQGRGVSVPERLAQQRYQLDRATQGLSDELGREPTDAELTDHLGITHRRLAHLRGYRPAVSEGYLADPETGEIAAPATRSAARVQPLHELWADAVYEDLDPYHKRVYDLAAGRHGAPQLSNLEIARRLRRSPGAISQAKARIQARLDEGPGLLEGL